MSDSAAPACAPFDPDPRAPRLRAPPLSCDCHLHVFGPIERYAYSDKRGYTPPDAPLSALLRMHDVLGIERAVLTQPSVYGTDNSAILDAVAAHPDRFRAVVAVDAEVTDKELRRLHERGARGIRINLVDKGGQPYSSWPEVEYAAARVRDLGWHVEFLVHVEELEDIAGELGGLAADVVVGHLGYMKTAKGIEHPGFRRFLDFVATGKCWVKLTGPYRITERRAVPYDDVSPYAQALVAARPDRMLWGSDWPHPITKIEMPNDGDLFDHFLDWVPDAGTRRRILVENPSALYWST